MADKSAGRVLAGHIANVTYDKLPAEVVEFIKMYTLDTLGVIAGAANAPGMAAVKAALTEFEPTTPPAAGSAATATLILSGRRVNPLSATLGNSAAAHSLDFDDCHDPSRVHSFCVLIPAVLAAAEAVASKKKDGKPVPKIDGKQLIVALTVGVEVFCRLGSTCYNCMDLCWHPTASLGCIAASASVAKLWGLNADQIMNSMALGFVQMGGSTQFMQDKVLAKRCSPGFASRNGIQAALLAKAGISGPYRFLEGDAGLFQHYQRKQVKPEILLDNWGKQWVALETSMKPWPCCRCTHTIIQLALELREKYKDLKTKPGNVIKSGVIELGKVNHKIVGADFDQKHPTPTVHAQFNACYTFACALIDGTVAIETFDAKEVKRPEFAWVQSKMRCVPTKTIGDTAMEPANIKLTFEDGQQINVGSETMKGSPSNPMSRDDTLAKFRANVKAGWNVKSDKTMAPLEKSILDMENIKDVSAIVSPLMACFPGGSKL